MLLANNLMVVYTLWFAGSVALCVYALAHAAVSQVKGAPIEVNAGQGN